MVTPLAIRSVSDQIYGYMLSSAYRSPWVYSPSGADAKEPDMWEIVRNQTDMLAEINRRDNNIVRPWRVAPNYHASYSTKDKKIMDSSKQLAAICHEGVSHCGNLDEARILLSEAFFTGRKYGVVLWEPVWCSLDGTQEMLWYLPYCIKDLDRRRVHWVPDWEWVKPDGTIVPAGSEYKMGNGVSQSTSAHPEGGYYRKSGVHLEIFNTNSWRWERVSQEMRRSMLEYVYYDSEDRVGHGRGTMEAGFFTHWFLTNTFKKITEGIDRYANGVLIGRLDSLRNASTDKTNVNMLSAMETVMNTFRSQHYLILGDGDDVEIKDAPSQGMQVAISFYEHLIASWARLCNGSVRPAGHATDGTGARAQAETEEDTGEAFYQNDRTGLDHVLDRDLVGGFLYHNQENIVRLGLEKSKRPKFTSQQIKKQDPATAISVMKEVLAVGQPILKTQFYENVDLTAPGDDDEVVEGSASLGLGMTTFGDPTNSATDFGNQLRKREDQNEKAKLKPKNDAA